MTGRDTRSEHWRITKPQLQAALLAGFFGTALLAIYAWAENSASAFAVGTLVSLAAGAVGGVAGFLFALPRYIPAEQEKESRSALEASPTDASAGKFIPGDNLMQISDWLTKLLIGAGLAQLGNISRAFGRLTQEMAGGFTNVSPPPASARVVAGSVIVFYALLGFLFFYGSTSLTYRQLLQQRMQS